MKSAAPHVFGDVQRAHTYRKMADDIAVNPNGLVQDDLMFASIAQRSRFS